MSDLVDAVRGQGGATVAHPFLEDTVTGKPRTDNPRTDNAKTDHPSKEPS